MRHACVLTCLLLSVYVVNCRRFDTRCALVRELLRVGMPRDSFLGQWVCLIENVSKRETNAFEVTPSGRKYYGLYQIPNKWCSVGKKGGNCNVACESLLDDNITDDTACAMFILRQRGFKFWEKWTIRCKNKNFHAMEINKCPDLMNRIESTRRPQILKRRNGRKRRDERTSRTIKNNVQL